MRLTFVVNIETVLHVILYCMTHNCTVFLIFGFQVQEAQCPHWEDLQQDSKRQVPLGHWYGWSWLCVLTTVVLVARVISWKDCVQWRLY